MTAVLIRGKAQQLPLPDGSVDLIVTSPPYFNQRRYLDAGEALEGQHGNEATTAEYVANLLAATREWTRVLKRSGSMFVVLGDKYSAYTGKKWGHGHNLDGRDRASTLRVPVGGPVAAPSVYGVPNKSLLGMPWRYALACIGGGSSLDDAGLIKALLRDVALGILPLPAAERIVDDMAGTPREGIGLGLRSEIIWHKTNAMPDSAGDRVGRVHEQIFHFTRHRTYFSAVDEIREPHARTWTPGRNGGRGGWDRGDHLNANLHTAAPHPLGRVPGSVWVWEIPTAPLIVPEWLEHARCCGGRKKPGCTDGLDHHAAFAPALVRRIIDGWCPRGICTACGEGRRPVSVTERTFDGEPVGPGSGSIWGDVKTVTRNKGVGNWRFGSETTIVGYACACTPYTDHPGTGGSGKSYAKDLAEGRYALNSGGQPRQTSHPGHAGLWDRPKTGPWREYHFDRWDPAPTRPAVILDPYSGTGTTVLVADVLGQTGIGIELSGDYNRLASWRVNDPGERARALDVPRPPKQADGQAQLEFGAA